MISESPGTSLITEDLSRLTVVGQQSSMQPCWLMRRCCLADDSYLALKFQIGNPGFTTSQTLVTAGLWNTQPQLLYPDFLPFWQAVGFAVRCGVAVFLGSYATALAQGTAHVAHELRTVPSQYCWRLHSVAVCLVPIISVECLNTLSMENRGSRAWPDLFPMFDRASPDRLPLGVTQHP